MVSFLIPRQGIANNLRANAFMNAWDPQGVRARVSKQTLGFLTHFGGKTRLHPMRVAMEFRRMVLEEAADREDPETLNKARAKMCQVEPNAVTPRIPFESLNWCCFTMMLSELGMSDDLADLLEYADEHLQPTWEKGGLFYPRNDALVDGQYNLVHMEALSGNCGIAYARLNVEDGQKIMWDEPWTTASLATKPWIDGVHFSEGVDFLRGIWKDDDDCLIVTLRLWQGSVRNMRVCARNLPPGEWAAFVDRQLVDSTTLVNRGDMYINLTLAVEEVDVVIQRAV